MPSSKKQTLIASIGGLIVRWQDATQKYDEAVGEFYGLSSTERLCLSFLWAGPQTASAVAREIRLTPAAITSLVDRLEARHFVCRKLDPNDRRKVLVEMAEEGERVTREAYFPIGTAGAALLTKYTEAELRVVYDVLEKSMAIQVRATDELVTRRSDRGTGI